MIINDDDDIIILINKPITTLRLSSKLTVCLMFVSVTAETICGTKGTLCCQIMSYRQTFNSIATGDRLVCLCNECSLHIFQLLFFSFSFVPFVSCCFDSSKIFFLTIRTLLSLSSSFL